MNTFLIRAIGAVALVGMLSGCEDDEEKYRSEPPLVADMVVTSLKDGSSNIHVGDKFTVTLVQKKKGRLLNASKYSWSSTPSGLSHKNALQSVIYDQESQNPVDTLTADAVDDYRINFSGKYNASGNTQFWSNKYGVSFTENFGDGNGKATYTTGGILYFTVQAYKNIKVLP